MPRQLKWELRRPYLQKCVWVRVCVLETGGMSIFLHARLLKSDFFSACVCGLPGMSVISCF